MLENDNTFEQATPIKKTVDLRHHFPDFTDFVENIGSTDKIRGWKMRTSPRVIARLKYGRVPARWVAIPPEAWRQFANDLERLHDSGDFERVYRYISKYRGDW